MRQASCIPRSLDCAGFWIFSPDAAGNGDFSCISSGWRWMYLHGTVQISIFILGVALETTLSPLLHWTSFVWVVTAQLLNEKESLSSRIFVFLNKSYSFWIFSACYSFFLFFFGSCMLLTLPSVWCECNTYYHLHWRSVDL